MRNPFLRTSNFELPTPQRILVIRLDRIGDVVLSTPVLHALRTAYPSAFIAMMVRPACREVVEGNPHLDAVILYEKEGRHRSLLGTWRFARELRQQHFDTAIVLHPTNRSHWIAYLAGIPTRIGYHRKSGWLLTHRVPHRKHEGAQHEAAYALELLRVLGIEPGPPRPYVPVSPDVEARVTALLGGQGVQPGQALVAIHPSASCISKRWYPDRFAAVADRLAARDGARIVLIAGPEDAPHAQAVARAMAAEPINLAGQLSVGELAGVLKRCRVLISNDSGPVHIAAALGVPVVDIFGRNQRGLSPARWGPIGPNHVVLHKEVGCVVCLAHNCQIDFKCLKAVTVDEVYAAARALLNQSRVV